MATQHQRGRANAIIGMVLVGLGAIGVILTVSHALNLRLVLLSVAGLATYTWFKRRWWGGPFYNAWIVAAHACSNPLTSTTRNSVTVIRSKTGSSSTVNRTRTLSIASEYNDASTSAPSCGRMFSTRL